MPILLELINQSTDTNNSQVIIFGESSGPGEGDDAVAAPLPVHHTLALPAAGERVSVQVPGGRVALEVVAPEAAGQPPTPPAHLTLPDAASTTVLVQGGGTVPIYFVIAAPEDLTRPRPATPGAGTPTPERPSAERPSAEQPSAPAGFLATLIAAIRRVLRMFTGG